MSISKNSLTGIICVVTAGVCWGSTGTIQAFMPPGVSPLAVGPARALFSGIILLAIMTAVTRGKIFTGRWDLKGVLVAALGSAMYQLTFFTAVKLTGVAVGTMVAIGVSPPAAGLLGRILFKERLSASWYIATAMTIAGCTMLILGGNNVVTVSFAGVLLALIAAAAYALKGVGLRWVRRSPYETIAMVTFISGIIALPGFAAAGDISWMLQPRGALCMLLLVFVGTIIPYTLFTVGIRKIELGTGYTLALTEPLTACLLSVFLLGERLSFIGICGICILFAGILFLALNKDE